MLYSRYSNPLEFMRLYIDQGRFGEFVTNIIDMDNKRKQEEAEKDDENKWFSLYVHSGSDKCFIDWKAEILSKQHSDEEKQPSEEVKKEQVVKIINDSYSILDSFKL